MDLDELIARAAIDSALQRYCRGVDRLDLELLLSAFHDEAVDEHGLNSGQPADIFPQVFARLSAMECTTHFLGRSSYEFENASTAYVETYSTAYHRLPATATEPLRDMVVGSRYVDRFEERSDAGWRISHRRVVVDWSRIDPVGDRMDESPFTRGLRDGSDVSYARRAAVS